MKSSKFLEPKKDFFFFFNVIMINLLDSVKVIVLIWIKGLIRCINCLKWYS